MAASSCELCGKIFARAHEARVHAKSRAHVDAVAAESARAELNAARQAAEQATNALRLRMQPTRQAFLDAMYAALETMPPRVVHVPRDLTDSIALAYEDSRPREVVKRRRAALIALIAAVLAELFPQAQLELYGSIPLELDVESSDVDLSVRDETTSVAALLSGVAAGLAACELPSLSVELTLTARIPLVSVRESLAELECDVSQWFDDKREIAAVLNAYLALEPRLRPLICAVRAWAAARGLRDAFTGTINSFGWTMMVLAFGIARGLLPCSSGLDVSPDVPQPRFAEFVPTAPDASLGELFCDFFRFLLAFDYRANRLSIRHGGVTAKEPARFEDSTVWVVERPRTAWQNVTRQVTEHTVRARLLPEFRRALAILDGGGLLSDVASA